MLVGNGIVRREGDQTAAKAFDHALIRPRGLRGRALKQAKDHNITIIVVKSAGRLALRVIPTLKDGAAVRLA